MLEKLQFMTIMLVNDVKPSATSKGATAVEYGLMVALIAVVIIGAVTALGDAASTACSPDVAGNGLTHDTSTETVARWPATRRCDRSMSACRSSTIARPRHQAQEQP